jgi:hypothetical protein
MLAVANGWHVEIHTGKRHNRRDEEYYLDLAYIRLKNKESGLVLSQQITDNDLETAADILLEKLRGVCS